jgi:hypothetical protein
MGPLQEDAGAAKVQVAPKLQTCADALFSRNSIVGERHKAVSQSAVDTKEY